MTYSVHNNVYSWNVNLHCIAANEGEPDKPNIPVSQKAQSMLEVGSAVEFGDPLQYGVIRQFNINPVVLKQMVTVEMVGYSAMKYNMYYYKCPCMFMLKR